jgi:hypothetical protein
MSRYHIDKKGEPGVCHATKSCPLGDNSEHYSTEGQARAAYEESMAEHIFYHVSRGSALKDILTDGLTPQKPEGDFPEGVYLFKDEENAEFFREVMDEQDLDDGGDFQPRQLWKVHLTGHDLHDDPAVDSSDPINDEYPAPLRTVFTLNSISPDSLEEME